MESREICGFPASVGIWIYLMIRLQRQIGNSRSFTNKVWEKLAHAKSVTKLPHEFVYSPDRELLRACTPSIAPDTIKFAARQFDGRLAGRRTRYLAATPDSGDRHYPFYERQLMSPLLCVPSNALKVE
jgi:hypothetical protein